MINATISKSELDGVYNVTVCRDSAIIDSEIKHSGLGAIEWLISNHPDCQVLRIDEGIGHADFLLSEWYKASEERVKNQIRPTAEIK